MAVFVLDRHKKPLMPCSEKRARLLLERGRAVVHRRHPFTVRLRDRIEGAIQPLRLKLDPGATTTGLALVRETNDGQHVLHLAELTHRGKAVRKHMQQRAMFRRRRRSANLRYRAPRFNNRTRPAGWLAPSLHSRLDNIIGWTCRYRQLAPVTAISMEHVRFDMQQLVTPHIQGIEYQQGDLAGYELREYLLEKWGHACAYCGITNVALQIEHIHPQARGGSNRASNLTLACRRCNEQKAAQPPEQFLHDKPEVLHRILAATRRPLNAAAAVNTVRWALVDALRATTLPVELGTGGRTKWNRSRLHVPKAHSLDAACVGTVDALHGWNRPVLAITCTGRGSYQRTRLTAHGFPRGYLMRQKMVRGFQTGDMVRAVVPTGTKAGTYIGRVAVRATASFNIQTPTGIVQGINAQYCTRLSRADGYAYHINKRARLLLTAEAGGLRRAGA